MKDDAAARTSSSPLPLMDSLIDKMSTQLEDFNAISKTPMDLVLFPFAVEHVCRVLRIVKQPFGNALLVGVGGSGRQSLTTLAAHVAQYEIFQHRADQELRRTAWREDLKLLLRQAGESGQSTVFLFSDTQIKDESFVRDANNVLNTGEVPNLFRKDEVANILEELVPKAKELGSPTYPPSRCGASS